MSQSRRESLIEAAISNGTSFVISVLGNMLILPMVGLHPTWTQSIGIGGSFQAIFMIKTYVIRRFFNRRHMTIVTQREKDLLTSMHGIESCSTRCGCCEMHRRIATRAIFRFKTQSMAEGK